MTLSFHEIIKDNSISNVCEHFLQNSQSKFPSTDHSQEFGGTRGDQDKITLLILVTRDIVKIRRTRLERP